MKKSINNLGLIFLFYFLLNSCGENVSYIQKEDITSKVKLNKISCEEDFYFKINEISLINTVQDTFLVRSHTDLNLDINLTVVNNREYSTRLFFNKKDNNPTDFIWIINYNKKIDTIFFYNNNNINEYIIEPQDSLLFSIKTTFFNFERLLGEQKNYTNDMLELLSSFKMKYNINEQEICIEQNSRTKIISYNNKSKWTW